MRSNWATLNIFAHLRPISLTFLTTKPTTMRLSKKTWGYYLIWVFLHFTLWILPKDGYGSSYQEFWPFTSGSLSETYDLSEFLIYSLLPLVIIYSIKLIRDGKS